MTITTTTNVSVHRGNSSATEFPYSFRIPQSDFVNVSLRNYNDKTIVTVLNSGQYTITGIDEDGGGEITYPLSGDPLTNDFELVIERIVPYGQGLDLINQGGFFPETLENQLDLTEMQIQQIASRSERSLTVPLGQTLPELPYGDAAGSKFLVFNPAGTEIIVSSGTGADGGLREDLANYNGGELVRIKNPVTGAEVRSIFDIIIKELPVSMAAFGADSTHVNDLEAWNKMIAAVNLGEVKAIDLLPSGMNVNGNVTPLTKGCSIKGIEKVSQIIESGGTGYLLNWADLPVDETVDCQGFDVITTREEGRRAIRASWVDDVVNTAVQRFLMKDVNFRGVNHLTSGFLSALDLENALSPVLKNVNAYGRQSDSSSAGHGHMEYWLNLTADAGNYTIDMRSENCTVYAAAKALKGTGHLEGIFLDQCILVFCRMLVDLIPTDTTKPPCFSFTDGQGEFYDNGFNLENWSRVVIADSPLFRNTLGPTDGTYTFVKVKSSQGVMIHNVHLVGSDDGSLVSDGFVIEDCNRGQLSFNDVEQLKGTSIKFTGTTQNFVSFKDVITPQTGGIPYINDSSNALTNERREMTITGGVNKIAVNLASSTGLTDTLTTKITANLDVQPGDKLRISVAAFVDAPSVSGALVQYQIAPTAGGLFKWILDSTTIRWSLGVGEGSLYEAREFTVVAQSAATSAPFNFQLAIGGATATMGAGGLSVERL